LTKNHEVSMNTLQKTAYPTPSNWLFSDDPMLSREPVTVLAGSSADRILKAGTVLGMITLGDVTVTNGAQHTGNGALTMAGTPLGALAVAGAYTVTITGGSHAATLGALVGTGNGVLTLASPAFGANVKDGEYRVVCIEEATDGGTFAIEDPDGLTIGSISVGGAFDGDIKIASLADGTTDFKAGSYFPITIAAAVPASGLAAFAVTGPGGFAVGTGVVGTAFTSSHVNFTWADGNTNMALGDSRVLTVASSYGKVVMLDTAGSHGEQTVFGVLYDTVIAPDGVDAPGVADVRNAVYVAAGLIWPDGISASAKDAAIAALKAKAVVPREAA
jgi:hypothetical protein